VFGARGAADVSLAQSGLAPNYFLYFFSDKVAEHEVGHETDRLGRYRRQNTGKFDSSATNPKNGKRPGPGVGQQICKTNNELHFAYPNNPGELAPY